MPQLSHFVCPNAGDDVDDGGNADDDNGFGGRYVISVTSVDDRRLYVLHYPCEQRVEVYDTTNFRLEEKLSVDGLSDRSGLTSCGTNNCLYANADEKDTVFKVELNNDNKVLKWHVNKPIGLSVNAACNLLVSCWSPDKVQEYTPDGLLVNEICLQSTAPLHAVQLANDQFVACFIDLSCPAWSYDVVEMNSQGRVVRSYADHLRTTTEHQFSLPCHVVMDQNNENIYVADHGNNRIVILNRSSKCAYEFYSSVNGTKLQQPCCLHLDRSSSRLYVVEPVDRGRIFVFNIRRRPAAVPSSCNFAPVQGKVRSK
jgi:hypothetical protein